MGFWSGGGRGYELDGSGGGGVHRVYEHGVRVIISLNLKKVFYEEWNGVMGLKCDAGLLA